MNIVDIQDFSQDPARITPGMKPMTKKCIIDYTQNSSHVSHEIYFADNSFVFQAPLYTIFVFIDSVLVVIKRQEYVTKGDRAQWGEKENHRDGATRDASLDKALQGIDSFTSDDYKLLVTLKEISATYGKYLLRLSGVQTERSNVEEDQEINKKALDDVALTEGLEMPQVAKKDATSKKLARIKQEDFFQATEFMFFEQACSDIILSNFHALYSERISKYQESLRQYSEGMKDEEPDAGDMDIIMTIKSHIQLNRKSLNLLQRSCCLPVDPASSRLLTLITARYCGVEDLGKHKINMTFWEYFTRAFDKMTSDVDLMFEDVERIENYVKMAIDLRRNRMISLEVGTQLINTTFAFGGVIGGILGMNIAPTFPAQEQLFWTFWIVLTSLFTITVLLFVIYRKVSPI